MDLGDRRDEIEISGSTSIKLAPGLVFLSRGVFGVEGWGAAETSLVLERLRLGSGVSGLGPSLDFVRLSLVFF